jgi:C4-dicarboxylate-specific signal transduction histidine kinase
MSPVSEAASHVLTRLSDEITRAAKIIRRTRDFVSTGKHQSERLNLSELVADTAAMLKGEARRRGLTIQIVDVEKNSVVLGDPVRLQQVLVNLVINALESMVDHPKTQKIATIEIKCSPKRVRISVLDSGNGVNESQRSRLFDAFFTTKTNGLGMGLAISRGIIEDHQGTLSYAPKEGGGSSFIIDLPSAP